MITGLSNNSLNEVMFSRQLQNEKSEEQNEYKFSSENYSDLTKNLSETRKKTLDDRLNELANKESTLEEISEAIQNNDLNAPIFTNPEFHLYALLAVREGKMSGMVFTTAILFSNTIRKNEFFEVVPLFIDEAPNPVAWDMVKATSVVNSGNDNYVPSKNNETYLPDEKLVNFFDLMRTKPKFEQQFLLIQDKRPIGDKTTNRTISHALGSIGYNAMMRLPTASYPIPKRMIASKSMRQAHLNAQSIERAPILMTRFCFSSFENLKNQILLNIRDMRLSFPFFKEITEVDMIEADPSTPDVEDHEGYHAQIILNIPPDDRVKFWGLCEVIENIMQNSSETETLQAVLETVIDMEHKPYQAQNDYRLAKDTNFWRSFLSCFETTKHRLEYQFIKQNPLKTPDDQEEINSLLKNYKDFQSKLEGQLKICFLSIITEMTEKGDHYFERYGIDILRLYKIEEKELKSSEIDYAKQAKDFLTGLLDKTHTDKLLEELSHPSSRFKRIQSFDLLLELLSTNVSNTDLVEKFLSHPQFEKCFQTSKMYQ